MLGLVIGENRTKLLAIRSWLTERAPPLTRYRVGDLALFEYVTKFHFSFETVNSKVERKSKIHHQTEEGKNG